MILPVRNFLDANEVETGAKLFVALSWPEDKRPHKNNNYQGFLKQYDVPGSLAIGQALQNMNIMFGLREQMGLDAPALLP